MLVSAGGLVMCVQMASSDELSQPLVSSVFSLSMLDDKIASVML